MFRLDPRLNGRIDIDDILQETFIAAQQRLKHILRDAPDSIFLWLRMILGQTLIDLHRRHLGPRPAAPARDRSLDAGWDSNSTSASIHFELLGSITSPSEAMAKQEAAERLDAALQTLNDMDREILALRHSRRTVQPGSGPSARHFRTGRQSPLHPGPRPAQAGHGRLPGRVSGQSVLDVICGHRGLRTAKLRSPLRRRPP